MPIGKRHMEPANIRESVNAKIDGEHKLDQMGILYILALSVQKLMPPKHIMKGHLSLGVFLRV